MAVELTTQTREQTRARYPDESGYVERDGVRIYYEVYGSGEPTVLLMPTWSVVHSRHWKMQIPYLARVNAEWRAVLTEAFEEPHRELGIAMPLEGLVSLVMTFNIGIMVERLGGIETDHDKLLDWIDAWLSS